MARRGSKRHLEPAANPVPCPVCAGSDATYSLAMFPMSWRAKCRSCGLVWRCELKLSEPRATAAPPPQQPYQDPYTGWPFGLY